MTDQNPSKIPKLAGDAIITLSTNREILEKEEEFASPKNLKLSDLEKSAFNGPYINLQNKRSIEIKLNRQLKVGDSVILLKDFPQKLFFRGYLCSIIEVYHDTKNPYNSQYEVLFHSDFEDDDLSLKSQRNNPTFDFPITHETLTVLRDDILRVEPKDLYYRTYFP